MSEPLYFHVLDGHDLGPHVFGEAQEPLQGTGEDGADVLYFTSPKSAGDCRHDAAEPACSLPHPFQTFAVAGDPDGYCADCRAQAEAIRPKSLEERRRLRRRWVLDTFGMSVPEWLYSLVLIASTAVWITWFAWGVGK